ncbi:MAG: class IV adenylate cyclase [Planctomycetota bacterium]
MRNIELKARCPDLARAEAVCRDLGAAFQWTRRQTDLYFRVADGRLKLRIEEPGGATLVRYHRPDQAAARESRYDLTPVPDPAATLALLERRHSLLVRVVKTRTLYLLGHIRIHLDRVEGLGTFLEFEAVMTPDRDVAATHARLTGLRAAFGVRPAELIPRSYSDLLLATGA